MLDYISYILLIGTIKFLIYIPDFIVKIVLKLIAILGYYLNMEHRKYAFANLNLAYGDSLSKKEKIKIIKSTYLNLAYTAYEFLENSNNSKEKITSMVEVENSEIIENAIRDNKKIIFITAHCANWELSCSYIAINYLPLTVVGRLFNNRFLNKALVASRTKHNTKMLSKHEAARGLVSEIRAGNTLGLVVDQNISEKNGILVDFFNHKARQVDSVSKLAGKFNTIIIPAFGSRVDFKKHKLHFYEPIILNDNSSIEETTQLQANIIEKHIKKYPNDWLWLHRRWKEMYEHIYD